VPQDATLRFDRFELDPGLGTITESGLPIHLQPQPFKLLVFLATRAGQLVTRAEIREHLWGKGTYVDFEASLNYCIRQIRNALGDDAENPRFIQTYPKRGYRFIAPTEIPQSNAPSELWEAGKEGASGIALTPSIKRRELPRLIIVAAVTLVAVLAAAKGSRLRLWPSTQSGATLQNAMATSHPLPSAQAYDAYLRGQYEWHQRTGSWKRGCEYFSQATQRDPAYAPAYAALSNCYRLLVWNNALPVKEGYAKANEAARRAVQLDPNSADAHTALGSNHLYIDWNWPAAHAEFERALRLNPSDAEAHIEYGRFLRLMGDFQGAIREGRRSVELDPLSNIARLSLCAAYAYANDLEHAVDECSRSVQLQPDSEAAYILLSQVFARQRDYDKSSSATVKALRLEGKDRLAERFMADYHKLGFARAEAQLAEEMKEEYRDPKAYETQLLFMQLDKKDSAIRFLEQGYSAHDALLISIKSDPIFGFLRDDPRFQELLHKMRFDSY
jgi:DNA-binding winged helix-turn-helix (wHTH) protein/lipopolysaccharide biosynthesis regulator YciM